MELDDVMRRMWRACARRLDIDVDAHNGVAPEPTASEARKVRRHIYLFYLRLIRSSFMIISVPYVLDGWRKYEKPSRAFSS